MSEKVLSEELEKLLLWQMSKTRKGLLKAGAFGWRRRHGNGAFSSSGERYREMSVVVVTRLYRGDDHR